MKILGPHQTVLFIDRGDEIIFEKLFFTNLPHWLKSPISVFHEENLNNSGEKIIYAALFDLLYKLVHSELKTWIQGGNERNHKNN